MSTRPDLFDRGWTALHRGLEAPIRGFGRPDLYAVGFLVILVGLLLSAPVLYVQDMPLDLFVQLDGAWRWAAGQRPHVDFYTPVGDLWYVLLGVAGLLEGGDPLLVVTSSVLLAPFVAAGAWIATDRRLPALPRVLLALAITCCALSPRTLDSSLISGVATYNRYGWAFVGIVASAVLLEPAEKRPIWPAVVVVTIAMVAIFWTKVTYLGLAGAAVGLALIGVPANRPLAALSGGLAAVGIGISASIPQGQAYLADLSRAAEAAAGGPGLLRFERIAPEIRSNFPELVAFAGLGLVLMRTSRDAGEERSGSRVVGVSAMFTLAALVITSQSHDQWIPVLVVPVAMVYLALRSRPLELGATLPRRLAGTALVGLLGFGLLLDAAAVTVLALRPRLGPTNALAGCTDAGRCVGERIRLPAGDPSSGMVEMVRRGEITGAAYDNLGSVPWNVDDAVILVDAMDLVEAHGLQQAKIASMTFSPSFPWLFGAPPPRHLPAWLDWQRTFGPADGARMAETLADADVVLVPKVWRVSGVSIAQPVLDAEFENRDSTALWTLWVRLPR